jgi:hypothetical protein
MLHQCKSISCSFMVSHDTDFCEVCTEANLVQENDGQEESSAQTLSQKYPKYYKAVGEQTEVDVYKVHQMFEINDPSGCIHHASKKLLLSGVRTGGKSAFNDIKEARDTLTRWLQLNQSHE